MSYYYVTTPIYYANGHPHIGNAYTGILADMLTRFYRYTGSNAFLLTGTDEHGEKIAESAKKAGKETQVYVDEVSQIFADVWNDLGIDYSRFIRTTDSDHKALVQKILQQLFDQGDIYFGKYSGYYCVGCERYLTEKELVDGKCPQHLVAPKQVEEENYFFRMEKYREQWLSHITEVAPDCLRPERYKNEILGMLREPLEDLSISRPKSRLSWGIEMPFDTSHVTYVWFDALLNYLSGIGYPDAPESRYRWAAVEHLVGKDIIKPHGVYWPLMLLAAGLPLYQNLTVHGYWVTDQVKISKSVGVAVDPLQLNQEYGNDALRYFYLREMSFGLDANFTQELFASRYQADLANNLGNLVSRTLAMVQKYRGGEVPQVGTLSELEVILQQHTHAAIQDFLRLINSREIHRALESLWCLIDAANVYIDRTKPWALAKDPQAAALLDTALYCQVETLRIIASLLTSILPTSSKKILSFLGFEGEALNKQQTLPAVAHWGQLAAGQKLREGEALFPRKDLEEKAATTSETPTKTKASKKMEAAQPQPSKSDAVSEDGANVIGFDDFMKVQLRVGQILTAEKVEKSDKLLKLTVDVGPLGERQVIAGIAKHFEPESIIGRKIVIVANLKPAKLMGLESQGMLLAGSDDQGNMELISPGLTLAPGSVVR